jgi:hypothetical protein
MEAAGSSETLVPVYTAANHIIPLFSIIERCIPVLLLSTFLFLSFSSFLLFFLYLFNSSFFCRSFFLHFSYLCLFHSSVSSSLPSIFLFFYFTRPFFFLSFPLMFLLFFLHNFVHSFMSRCANNAHLSRVVEGSVRLALRSAAQGVSKSSSRHWHLSTRNSCRACHCRLISSGTDMPAS